ncbi:MAG: peptidoglycan-binding protein [Scytolyngbya sp. HA4215-MV1]|nr:peptidoglycan-binding protein [Scytolyngbya sp. HA4215-MV1]
METLAYLHAACAYESAPDTASELKSDKAEPIVQGSWGRLSSPAVLRLLSLMVGLLVVSLSNAAIAASLQQGDTGSEVSALQEKLTRLGYFEGPQTGYFGSLTQEAVIRFQRESGLSADGVYGAQTQQLLEQKASSRAVGMQSAAMVSAVQQKLRDRGYYDGAVDGIYGSLTRTAVTNFQRDFGLKADGIVGPRTLAVLNGNTAIGSDIDPPSAAPVSALPPSSVAAGVSVSEIQRLLRFKGYYNGAIDSVYSPATRSAVIKFQQDQGLKPDGIVGSQTIRVLRGAMSRSASPSTPFIRSEQTSDASRAYFVLVPYRDNSTLEKVRRLAPDAFLTTSQQGAFIQAGSFNDRAGAEKWSQVLRSQGLNAQIN